MSRSFGRPLFARALTLAPAILSAGIVGCSAVGGTTINAGASPFTQGSGTTTTETRTVGSYHAIAAATGVTVIVEPGVAGSLSVTADDNLLPQITTEVRDGTLYVGIDGGLSTRSELRVQAAASSLDRISASTGSTVDAANLDGTQLAVTASTGATVRGGGKVEQLQVSADTGASADLRNVTSTTAEATVSTGGSAWVRASEKVAGSCLGGSTLHVLGGPASIDVATDAGSTVKSE